MEPWVSFANGFAAGCEAVALPRRTHAAKGFGAVPLTIDSKDARARKLNYWGRSPRDYKRDRRRGKPPPHIRRRSRNKTGRIIFTEAENEQP